MPPKGWKKNALGVWYDPNSAGCAPSVVITESIEVKEEEVPLLKQCERGQQTLTRIPSKQRRFSKGI